MEKGEWLMNRGPIGDATSLSVEEVTDALENKMITNGQQWKLSFLCNKRIQETVDCMHYIKAY